MFSLSLAQLRTHLARLVATTLAIVIAVGFVVATLVLNETTKTTVFNAVAGQYKDTDAVVTVDDLASDYIPLSERPGLEKTIRSVPGVAALTFDRSTYAKVIMPGKRGYSYAEVSDLATDKRMQWQRLSAGRMPTGMGEVAVGKQKDIAVGDTLTLQHQREFSDEGVPGPDPAPQTVKIVGLVDLKGTVTSVTDQLFAIPAQATAWGSSEPDAVRVLASPGIDAQTLAPRIHDALTKSGEKSLFVRTGEDEAESVADSITGDAAQLAIMLLVFATVAVLVCGLVIANTFSVLLAQRTRSWPCCAASVPPASSCAAVC